MIRKYDPEKARQERNKYKERRSKNAREWSKNNPEKRLANWLKYNYSLSLFDYTKMYHSQDGKCEICKTPISFYPVELKNRNLKASVDHDHSTGKVRGLLCGQCNRGIGFLRDSVEITLSANNYLKKYSCNSQEI